MTARIALFLLALMPVAGCSAARGAPELSESKPRLFEGMGQHARAVQTSSPEAQKFFDQGLIWTYAFNHDEAIRSYGEAARLDPDCAMAWWGIALCNGPHINNPVMPAERSVAAWDALQRAIAARENAGPVERELIDALAERYASPTPEDRRPLDEAYAAAMKRVYESHPDDADIATLYAEALMDLQPWDLWAKDGSPKGNTNEILAVIEHALTLDAAHPGANHLYIHAVEASPQPERGIAAADRLRNLVPVSGHLVHMPSHIDVQVGRWAMASAQNQAAAAADRAYRKLSPKQGFYNLYMAHNNHFLAFACMMEGRSAIALEAADAMLAGIPDSFVRDQSAFADPFLSFRLDVLKRFGRWDDVLKEPRPRGGLPISTAMWHYSRGIAHAAKGNVDAALKEQEQFRSAVKKVPQDALTGINPAHKVLSIADRMLTSEIEFRRGKLDEAVSILREAVAIEDDLLYMEPPEWMQPVRHTLGAFLTSAKRYSEAEDVYRADLKVWPENGWSLYGLAQSLKAQGKTAEAKQVEERFAKTWAKADVKIGSSCLCVKAEEASCCTVGR